MKVNEFYSHTVTQRLFLVRKKGEFISRIKYYGFFIELYLLDDTFIEIYYNIHSKEVDEVEVLDVLEPRLHLFVSEVDISDLYKR